MSLSWELMTSDERKRAVELADQRYALLMSGVSHDELDKWLAKINAPEPEPYLLTTEDVAKLLGVSDKHSITKLCRTRALPRTKVRGTSRFKIDEVLAWAKLHGRKVNRATLRAASKT